MIADEFVSTRDMPPLQPAIETFDKSPQVQLQLSNVPPVPRVWFESEDGRRLVQVQRDRFHYNQRRLSLDNGYVELVAAWRSFTDTYSTFLKFLESAELGELEPIQCELSYVNVIPAGEGWDTLDELGRVLPDFSWRSEREFLPTPEVVTARLAFPLPDQQGRLHVDVRSGLHTQTGEPVLQLQLTVRGLPSGTTPEAMEGWFNLAREWIVKGFVDLTDEGFRRDIWKQRDIEEEGRT